MKYLERQCHWASRVHDFQFVLCVHYPFPPRIFSFWVTLEVINMKKCGKCKKVKPLTEFHKDKTHSDGHDIKKRVL